MTRTVGRIGILALGLAAAAAPRANGQTPLSPPDDGASWASPTAVAGLVDPVVRGLSGDVGIAVYSVDRERALYVYHPDRVLLPASNMKLYTTAAALDRLGPDFQYTTSLYVNGPIRPDGTLEGDVIVVGRGDPAISGRFYGDSATYVFDQFAARLRHIGVRRVTGRLIGDASYFDDARVAPGWESGNLLWWYGARVSALSFNDNVVTITVRPGDRVGAPASVSFYPHTDVLGIVNRVTTTGARGGRSIGISRRPAIGGYELIGRIPVQSAPLTYVVAVDDPPGFAVSVLRDRIERAGIAVLGADRVVYDRAHLPPGARRLVASHTSPRMAEIVRVINKRSQNFFAEQVLKTMGAVHRGEGSFSDGREVVRDALRDMGVEAWEFRMDDGSGLSRLDRTTARVTAQLLVAMRRHTRFAEYYDSLLLAGADGDPRRLDHPAARGNVRTKTGTLRGVSALSGYVTTRDGELLAFSVITNGLRGGKGASIAVEDAVAERLAAYSAWRPPLLERDTGF